MGTEPRLYGVQTADREPLLEFMLGALRAEQCRIIFCSPSNRAPFRITFETPQGERIGIVAYAFLANSKVTKNRPKDEHRLQVKYGSKQTPELHDIWQDPYGLYTTILLGINPEQGFFVGLDPVLHNPTKFFIMVGFKQAHVDAMLEKGWHWWERDHLGDEEDFEILVGGTPRSFLQYIRFEREAVGEDQGHRQLLAERASRPTTDPLWSPVQSARPGNVPELRLHALAKEFELAEHEVLSLIEGTPRLKMAVRGWVAEEHLVRKLRMLPGVASCERITKEGGADVRLTFEGSDYLEIECKNVLRSVAADHVPRLDFQRTRTSKGDPCSRFYRPGDFDLVAACLHSRTERWEFRYALPRGLAPHKACAGRLSNNVRIDSRWTEDAASVLRAAATGR